MQEAAPCLEYRSHA